MAKVFEEMQKKDFLFVNRFQILQRKKKPGAEIRTPLLKPSVPSVLLFIQLSNTNYL